MPRKPSTYLQRLRFASYLIIAAIIPYSLRLGHYYLHQKEIPNFYMNEWDLFVFCIAIAIAIMVENKTTKTTDYKQIVSILVLLIIPTWGMMRTSKNSF